MTFINSCNRYVLETGEFNNKQNRQNTPILTGLLIQKKKKENKQDK